MNAPDTYRGWSFFHEPGQFNHGACQVETGWGATKGSQRIFMTDLELRDRWIPGGNSITILKRAIDQREEAHA